MVLYDSRIVCSICGRRITGPEAVYEVKHRKLCSQCAWITRSRNAKVNRGADVLADEILYRSQEGTDTVSQEKEKAHDTPTPAETLKSWSEIYDGLSEYVIGQESAKQALATALF